MIPNSPSANDKIGGLFQFFLISEIWFSMLLFVYHWEQVRNHLYIWTLYYPASITGDLTLTLSSHIPAPQNFISPGYYLPVYQMPSGFPFNSHLTSDQQSPHQHLIPSSALQHMYHPLLPCHLSDHSSFSVALEPPVPSPGTCLSARLFASSAGH